MGEILPITALRRLRLDDPYGAASLRALRERDFQDALIIYAEQCGWKQWHVDITATRQKNGKYRGTAPPGWPDLFMCRDTVAIAAELKSQGGRVEPEQTAWLRALEKAGIETYVWRPSDAEEIYRVLA